MFTSIMLISACGQKTASSFPDPVIESGMAKLTGRLIGLDLPDDSCRIVVQLGFGNVVTGEQAHYETDLRPDDSFYFEVPVDRDIVIAGITVVRGEYAIASVAAIISSRQDAEIEIQYDHNRMTRAGMQGYVNLTDADVGNIFKVIGNMHQMDGRQRFHGYNTDQNIFINSALEDLSKRLHFLHSDSLLSRPTKRFIESDFKMTVLDMVLLDYTEAMEIRYRRTHPESEYDRYIAPPEPGISYYKFLRKFNLNDPQNLIMGLFYPAVIQKLFTIDALAIPPIDETPVTEWLAGVKTTLADVVGFSEGQFYDLLVSNAYGRQFEMETRPLSEKQIANIKDYFRGDKAAFAEILMRRNAEIEKLATGVSKLVVNETPDVPDEQLLYAIVAKHKGKVVVIDFWATWCGPCLQAIKQIREMKSEFNPDGIAYIYLTSSPPEELWRDMIVGIGSEHYRLPEEQWDYLIDKFDFEGIPSYVIIDSVGEVHDSFTGYPGNDRMKKIITELLQ